MRAQSFAMFALEAQMQRSASRQMPSGPTPSAQTRRFDKVPSAAMSKAVSRAAKGLGDDERLVVRRDHHAVREGELVRDLAGLAVGVMSAILPGALPLVSTSLNSAKSKLIVLT
jgi:hypothetical protein